MSLKSNGLSSTQEYIHSTTTSSLPDYKFLRTYVHVEEYIILVVIPAAHPGLTEFPQVTQKEDQELGGQTSSTGRTTFQHYFYKAQF